MQQRAKGLRLFKKVGNTMVRQLLIVDTSHALRLDENRTDGYDDQCEPWFIFADSIMRGMIAELRTNIMHKLMNVKCPAAFAEK